MLYFPFKNYEEFKEICGVEKRSNDLKVRKNKILLGHYKSKKLLHESVKNNNYELLHVTDMIQLQKMVFEFIRCEGFYNSNLPYKIKLMDLEFYSAVYKTDEANGVCADHDSNSVRYINVERNKVFKMKAAKFLRAVMLETKTGKMISESVINWICGDVFTQKWNAFASRYVLDLKLHVDDNFEGIYNSENLEGNFHSCMVNCGYHGFYSDSVSAKAAYLTNIDGKIVSRAIIYTDVKDEDGKTWRLCERQYCSDENELLKRLLVDKLIHGGYIDGYKTIGASCHDSRAFVANDGSSLRDKKFQISCKLDDCDDVSYQDSFKWFDFDRKIAFNYEAADRLITLDITGGSIGDLEWDDWNEHYCNETQECYYHGCAYYVDVENMDDFVFVEPLGEYHHEDDVTRCDYCECYMLNDDELFSNITDEYYCCEDCMESAEREYKRNNWYYAYYENEYYESEDDITTIQVWNEYMKSYEPSSIGVETLDSMENEGSVLNYNGEYFNEWDTETNLPYGINK